jgi:Fe-S-cluster-containing dehydrogenase component
MAEKRYGMVLDTRTCVGCNACVIGCKTENDVPAGYVRDWVFTETTGKFPNLQMTVRSERCNHCDDAPCVSVCPTGASHYGPGSTVQVNPKRCSGCKVCIAACPYDARYIDPNRGAVDKCTFCMHRIENGVPTTSCQEICPTGSIAFGDLNDPNSEVSKLLETREHYTLAPDAGTRPKHFYLK